MWTPAMPEKAQILIIEDDLQISQFLQSSLKASGYHTMLARTLADGKSIFSEQKPHWLYWI
jgi:two-component system KDP operon response regulator KdpE